MRRLLSAELLRLWSRRLVIALAALMIGLSALIAFPAALQARPVTVEEREAAVREYQQDFNEWADDECSDELSEECLDTPDLSDYLREPATALEAANSMQFGRGWLIALLSLVVAGSFVAAEFRSGSITTWVLFHPDRTGVYLAKLGAAAVSVAVITTASAGAALGVLAATIVGFGGTFDLRDVPARLAMNLAGGLILGAVGAALGVLTRHTIAVAGVVAGTGLVELVATLLGYVDSAPASVLRWLPSTQLAAVFNNGTVVDAVDFAGYAHSVRVVVPAGEGLSYWTALALVVGAAALVTFRRCELR